MKNFLRTPLSFTQTQEYFLQTLSEGHALAHELLSALRLEEGIFFAVTSTLADVTKLREFRYGGILSLNPLETVKVLGKEYPARKQSGSKEELARFLYQELMKGHQGCCIFEEVAFEKGDECLSKVKENIAYFADEVYYFLDQKDCTEERLTSLIQTANAQWYYMNIITEAPIKSTKLMPADLKEMASKATLIVLGAYDMEGYVCWEKAR